MSAQLSPSYTRGVMPKLPVMMVTAYADDERRRIANARGAADFLAKPVDFDFLKQQLLHFAPPPG